MVIKRVLCRMMEKGQADVVLSRKAFFVRYCLKSARHTLNAAHSYAILIIQYFSLFFNILIYKITQQP